MFSGWMMARYFNFLRIHLKHALLEKILHENCKSRNLNILQCSGLYCYRIESLDRIPVPVILTYIRCNTVWFIDRLQVVPALRRGHRVSHTLTEGFFYGLLQSFKEMSMYYLEIGCDCFLRNTWFIPICSSHSELNKLFVFNLRISRRWLWKVLSFGKYHHIVRRKETDVSEEYISSIFMIEE
jgi:hypothetical protein